MGLSAGLNYLEAGQLKLNAEHFPLPCSLRELVLQRYGDQAGTTTDDPILPPDELLAYLKNTDGYDTTPLAAVLIQTEAIGDPAVPSPEQTAILQWLDAALQHWEQHFPLEEPLGSQLRPLKSLAAALAVSDPDFLRPGTHPLHQLLDTLQDRAIGWHPQLGRAGQALEQQFAQTISNALDWFDDQTTDLTTICSALTDAAERDQVRAQRMTQRVIETERGRVKTADAKLQAARMINAALEKFPAPEEIGEFLKGHWYTSAQLVLLKFGADSEAWQEMSATTETLLDSLQSTEAESESRRQYIFEVVTQLPKDMRRWLLSLHHDTDAVNDAMGQVEFAHLRVLRRQAMELKHIDPLATENGTPAAAGHCDALDNIETGQWFRVDRGSGEPLRVQLVLRIEPEQQLVFTNQAGIKVLQQSFQDFAGLINQNQVIPLDSGATFSLSLATAAGLESTEELEALSSDAALQTQREQEEVQRLERESEAALRLQQKQKEAERLQREQEEAQRLQREREETERLQREQEEAQRLQREREEAERLQREQEEAQRLQREREETERLQREQEEAQRLQREQEQAQRLQREREEAERLQREQEEARQLEREREEAQRLLEEEAEKQARIEAYRRNKEEKMLQQTFVPEDYQNPRGEATATAGSESPAQLSDKQETRAEEEAALTIPMGAWLGFHDGDTPLMAKLAVHDREQDNYIFVNRDGIKMRQLSKQELIKLMEFGLVDILQTNSRFREHSNRPEGQGD